MTAKAPARKTDNDLPSWIYRGLLLLAVGLVGFLVQEDRAASRKISESVQGDVQEMKKDVSAIKADTAIIKKDTERLDKGQDKQVEKFDRFERDYRRDQQRIEEKLERKMDKR